MMAKLPILLLASLALHAQPVISNIQVAAKSHTWIRMTWDTNVAATNNHLKLDPVNDPPTLIRGYNHNYGVTYQSAGVSGLKPNTSYYGRVCSTVASVEACSATFQVTTDPEPADRFRDPDEPNVPPLPEHVITYSPVYAATYTASTCAEVQTHYNTVKGLDPNLNYRIIVPDTGCVNKGGTPLLTLTSRGAGTGYIDITSSLSPDELPPPGVRIDLSWQGRLPVWRQHSNLYLIAGGSNAKRVRFLGIEFVGGWDPATPSNIVDVQQLGAEVEVTTSAPHNYQVGRVVQLWNLGGLTPGYFRNVKITSVTTTSFLFVGTVNGTYTGGGWHLRNPEATMVYIGPDGSPNPAQEIVFDRCIVRQEWPRTGYSLINLNPCTNCAVVNSYFYLDGWRARDPVTGANADGGAASWEPTAIATAKTTGTRIENNTIIGVGIQLFSDSSSSDALIRRNSMSWPNEQKNNHPSSNGYNYTGRHAIELKGGLRYKITGNDIFNQWDEQGTGTIHSAITVTPRHSSSGLTKYEITDLNISNNHFRDLPGVFGLSGTQNGQLDVNRTRRVLIHNNLITGLDGRLAAREDIPNGNVTALRGTVFYSSGGLEDLVIDHNTIWNPRGTNPALFALLNCRGSGLRVKNNIFGINSNTSTIWILWNSTIRPSGITTPVDAALLDYWRQVPDSASDSAFWMRNNIFVPGVKSDTGTELAWDDVGNNWTPLEARKYFGSLAAGNTFFGGFETTANSRFATFKLVHDSDFSLRHDSPVKSGAVPGTDDGRDAGADILALWQEMGKIGNARVLDIGFGTATIAWDSYSGETCHSIDWTADNWGSFTRVLNASEGRLGVQRLHGLPAGELEARINCPVSQPILKWTGE